MTTRVALVHDYFTQAGGAERVVEQLARVFPEAPVYTSVVDPDRLPPGLRGRDVRTTALQALRRRGVPLTALAPLLPAAFGRLDLSEFDVVLSSSSGFAHHVRTRPDAVHVCYCHTPPRFLWEPGEYFRDQPLRRAALEPGLAGLRRVDRRTAPRVDTYVAVSSHIAARIRRVYGREAWVVHPPVDTSAFRPSPERSGRFLLVSRLRNYKRIELAVEAANDRRLPLDIVGEGPLLPTLRRIAGPTVRLLGRLPDPEVRAALARCTALLVPGVQDFGLTIVEAQASGRPPIALAAGGALDAIRDGETGFLFAEPTVEALGAAMERALREPLDPAVLVAAAHRFDTAEFGRAIRAVVAEAQAEPTAVAAWEPVREAERVR